MNTKFLWVAAAIGLLALSTGFGHAQNSTAPGQRMHEKGSVPGHPGASGYAPGHQGRDHMGTSGTSAGSRQGMGMSTQGTSGTKGRR